MTVFEEREIKEATELCDAKGNLNPGAVGWTRFPIHLCNLKGHWPRKKCWNRWTVFSDQFVLSMTVTNADIVGYASGYFIDFETGESLEQIEAMPLGIGCEMPPVVESGVQHSGKKLKINFAQRDAGVTLKAASENFGGKEMSAAIDIDIPDSYESLGVVIPWSPSRFSYSCSQTALPAIGILRINGRTYTCDPGNTYASLDFNRSVMQKKYNCNLAVISGRRGDDIVGANFVAGDCRDTGLNQNGVLLNGTMKKLSEEVVFRYDRKNLMKPWSIQSEESDTVDLVLEPTYERQTSFNKKLAQNQSRQVFGRFLGTLLIEDRMLALNGIGGWVEESVIQ